MFAPTVRFNTQNVIKLKIYIQPTGAAVYITEHTNKNKKSNTQGFVVANR